MAYRPNHPVIIVVNANGGGYVKQFDTMSEAKDFYKTITTDGVAYLYAAPKASLGFGNASDSIPEYNNGMTYGTGALVKLNGTVYKLINFIGAGGYGPVSHPAAWTTNVTLPPLPPPISSTGLNDGSKKGMAFDVNQLPSGNPFGPPPNDTLLNTSQECVYAQEYDRDGILFTGNFSNETVKTYSSGLTTVQQNGRGLSPCFYPNGFRIDREFVTNGVKFEARIIDSLDFSGTVYGPYYNPRYILRNPAIYTVADGNGGTTPVQENGVCRIEERQGNVPDKVTWVDYAVGDAPYSFNNVGLGITERIGQPIPNGRYLVTYKVDGDERIHSGAWVGRIENVDEGKVVWKFESETPDQPPPPACSIKRPITNPVNGASTQECDPDVIYPFSVYENCAEPIVVQIEGVSVTLGTNTKRGMDNGYGEVIWGQCTGMVYVPNGQLVHDGLDYYYYSDGAGSYTIEAKQNNCPAAGTSIGRVTTELTVTINAGTYTVGYQYEDTMADGNCGSSGIEISSEYVQNGTLLTEDSTYRYYSNGAGSYYTEEVNTVPPYGTELSTDGGSYTANAGCGDYNVGYWSTTTYADGMGGTYSAGGSSYTPNGQFVGNCNDYNYYSNGQGGLYQGEYTGNTGGGGGGSSYPSYGTTTGNGGSGDNYITINGSSYTNGSYTYTEYHDGNGGYYSQYSYSYNYYGYLFTSTSYYDSETMNEFYTYYYSDGNGGYYQQ